MNVFDIQVGVAITIAVADGSRAGRPAEVRYLDAWAEGVFGRPAKLHWLADGSDAGRLPNAVPVPRKGLEDFRPHPFGNGEWPSLRECFGFSKSGMKSGRDPIFVDADRDRLVRKVDEFLVQSGLPPHDPALLRRLAYRPCDLRWFYNDLRLLNRPGPELQRVWGADNVGFYALPGGTNAGPAVWCHSLLPDYHAIRGNNGGYAFPLHDRRPASAGFNLSSGLLAGLTALYGATIAPEEVFDAILCLLSARSYTLRFAEDLEDTFPHVPFPADHGVFQRAAGLGARIRAIQTFAQAPAAAGDPAFVQLATVPSPGTVLDAGEPDGPCLTLCADGSGRVEGLPATLWGFEVSRYPVLRRWLDGREGQTVDLALFDAFRDVCGRIADLVDLFGQADTILFDALDAPLTREAMWPTQKEPIDD
ncbi:hypothetical protein STAQ_37840 [Allostella sp. ATCC 35155]|nr:hypothetical protein STAQ_37840 [Stella sp. ATCC 35155]